MTASRAAKAGFYPFMASQVGSRVSLATGSVLLALRQADARLNHSSFALPLP